LSIVFFENIQFYKFNKVMKNEKNPLSRWSV